MTREARALLLGAGLVSRPLVRYLLDAGIQLTVADCVESKAVAVIDSHPAGIARAWTFGDDRGLAELVAEHDLTISLLPATMHDAVARVCIEHRKNMVTASYVSPAMKALDADARAAGILVLNEVGVDPGIDHMSAMQVIDGVKNKGGKITSFRSYCGGLPAPEANDNPWGYKLSWSPQAVLRAGTNSARYLKNGQLVEIAPEHLFLDTHSVAVDEIGELEAYPNRDSMKYADLYDLKDVTTMFRGTLRYEGWCETLRRVAELDLLDEVESAGLAGKTWAQLMAQLIGARSADGIREKVAAYLWLPPDSATIRKLEWLGLFSEEQIPRDRASVMELLSDLMLQKMAYAEGERDMIVMHHEFVADYGERAERITATMVDFGIPGGDSSMARTVSLPTAIAARLVLERRISDAGVHIPIRPHIYGPVLAELETLGIALKEKTCAL